MAGRRHSRSWPAGLVALAAVTVAAAQDGANDAAASASAAELRGIRLALERLVALEEGAERHAEIDLLFKRIALRERRLEPLEREARTSAAEVRQVEAKIEQLGRARAQGEQQLAGEIREGIDAPRSDTRRSLDDIDRSQLDADSALKDARARQQQAESSLAHQREDVAILDELLAERLEALER